MLKKLDIENCHFIVFAIKYFKISRFCYFFFVWTDCGPRFFESMATGTTWDGSECRLTSSRSTSRVSRTRPVPCSRSPPTINTWRKSLMSKSLNQVTEFSPFVSKSDFRVLSLFITVRFQSSLPLCITVGIRVLSLLFFIEVTEFSPLFSTAVTKLFKSVNSKIVSHIKSWKEKYVWSLISPSWWRQGLAVEFNFSLFNPLFLQAPLIVLFHCSWPIEFSFSAKATDIVIRPI